MDQETWTCSVCELNELSNALVSCLCGISRKINKSDLKLKYKNNISYVHVINILNQYLYNDLISIILMYYGENYKFKKIIDIGYLSFIQNKNEKIYINDFLWHDYIDIFNSFETHVYDSENSVFLRDSIPNIIIFYVDKYDLPRKISRYNNTLYILYKKHIYIIKKYKRIEIPNSRYSTNDIVTFKNYKKKLYYSTGYKIFEYFQEKNNIFYETIYHHDDFYIYNHHMYIFYFCEGKGKITVLKISTSNVEKNISLHELKLEMKYRYLITVNENYIFLYQNSCIYLIDHNGKLMQIIDLKCDVGSIKKKHFIKNYISGEYEFYYDKENSLYVDNKNIYLSIDDNLYIYSMENI